MSVRRVCLLACLFAGACQRTPSEVEVAPATANEPAAAPAQATSTPEASVDNDGTFLGRTIAQTMGYQGAGWLTRDNRDDEENTTLLHEQLGLKPGQTACDLGAGNGYHTLKMAQAVAPEGKAVAIDIQPEMLELLKARAADTKIGNVEYVLSVPGDPKLGENRCDLILLVDVYHEFADPAAMLQAMKDALTPTGRVALAEFRAEDPEVPIKELHKMTKEQAVKEFASVDLQLVGSFDGLPWQHLLFFGTTPRGQ